MENNLFQNTSSNSENFINRPAVAKGLPVTPDIPFPNLSKGDPLENTDPMDLFNDLLKSTPDSKISSIPLSSFSRDSRYSRGTRPGDDWEEQYAQNQTWYDQAFRGTIKGLNLAGTTVAGGFGTIYGLGAALVNGDVTKIFNNSVNQRLQEWNEKVDRELLPNFYTKEEQDAEWWSRDNWMTSNFLFDKLIKNSGYAVGAMVGGNISNSLLGKLGTSIGVRAANLATKAEMSQAFKFATPLLKNTARAFSRGKNIEAFEILSSKLSSLADATNKANQLAKLTTTTSKYANFGDTARRGLVALYSSAGEASMEAIMGGNQMKDNLIQKYIDENGIEPTGQALEDINNTVREFGKVSFFGNMALLGLTEYVQLPYLAGSSWKNSRNAIKNTTNDVISKGGKLVEDLPTTRFSKLYKGAKKYGQYVFDPKEAGQEIGQFALEVGTSNYFEKANETTAAEDWMDAVLNMSDIAGYGFFGRDEKGEGVGALVSKEGIEGGILGGITGGLMQAPMKFAETKARKTNTQRLIEESNKAPLVKDVIIDRINTANRGTVLQQQQQVAALQNDILESKDLKTDLAFNYAMHKVKYGRTDLVLDELADIKQQVMTGKEGFPELQGEGIGNTNDTKEEFLARITELETFVKDLDNTYDQLNTIYGAETIKDASTGELRRRFSDAAIERLAYATTKMKDYDARIPELKSKLASKGIVLDQALSDVVNNPKSTSIEEKLLEVDAFNSTMYTDADKNELKQTILDVTDLTLRKKLFINEFNEIIKKPENFTQNVSTKSSIETTEETDIPKNVIKIKTSKGEFDIETNTQYRLGRIVDYTKDGKEVYRAPIVEILGENEDGTIKIKDVQKGDVFDVSKETIEDYYLYKASDLGPTANFVLENFNTKFRHKGLKNNGKPAIGRIFNQKGQIIFEYVDDKGKLKRVPVRKSQFEAQGDYKKGMIVPVGKYTAAQEKSLKDLFSIKEEISDSEVVVRNQFLSKLYEDGMKRIQEIEKSLSSKKEEIEKISKKIEDLTLTKTGAPRKRITSTLRQQIDSLSKLKTSLEKQLEAEQNEKEELEYTVPFFKDMIEELSEFPEDNSAFIGKLKSDIELLEDLINITDKSIDDTQRLIEHVNELLSDALSVFNDYIKRLKEENPNIPLGIEQLEASLERFFTEEGIKQFIEQKQGFTARVLELEADINDFENELNIPGLSKKAETLIDDLNELSEGIDKLVGEQLAKKDILEKFQKFVDERKQMEQEEASLSTNKKFKEEALKTEDKSTVQTRYNNPNYEPNKKKQTNILPISTVGIDRGKPHQTRAKIFAANLPKYKDVYGVYVSVNNEAAYGLDGLIDLIRTDDGVVNESVNANKILAMVMVNGNGELLGVDGKPLTEEQLADAKNHAIFQVKPDPEFTWKSEKYGKGEDASMFRKGTPENVKKAIIEKYTKEKEALLSETGKGAKHPVAASWGIPEFEINEEGEINYEAKNSVESTSLIDKTTEKGNVSLEAKQLITVPTVNEIESQGLTSYSDALGKPFLVKDNAVVPLINKKHTQEEAEAIYDALLGLAKAAMSGKQGLKSKEATRILNFLRGVVYWGIPKDQNNKQKPTGYNSIFFETNPETGKLTLTISNKGYDVVFTPTELERNRGEVIDKIKELHNNINSTLVKKINNKFEQILSISPEGEVKSIVWPNYQSYLLADYLPDADGKITTKGKKRNSNDIPLTTPMRKTVGENDINRHSLYFYTTDTLDDYTFEELQQAKKEVAAKKMAPGTISTDAKGPVVETGGESMLSKLKGKGLPSKEDKQATESQEETGGSRFDKLRGKTSEDLATSSTASVSGIENINERLDSYGNAKVVLSKDFNEGERPKGRLNAFKEAVRLTSNNLMALKDINLNEFDFITEEDKNRLDALRPLAKELQDVNLKVSSSETRNTDVEKRFAQLTNKLSNEFVDIIGKYVEEQLGKTISSSKPIITTLEEAKPKTRTLAELRQKAKNNLSKPATEDPGFREVIKQKITKFENWSEVEAFIKKAIPNVPVYRVDNILKATNGKQYWGMFQDGAIYVYKNAEVGTAYHEVFEAIWGMFSDAKEKENIINEFRSRKGTFVDRPSGKTIQYKDATAQEIKEQLAEEFRDYVQFKKVPVKPKDGRPYIVKLFSDLVNAIKAFFLGPQAARNTEELFKRIGEGYYAKRITQQEALSYARKGIIDINDVKVKESAQAREKLTDLQISDVVEEMTYTTMVDLFKTNQSLFEEISKPKSELYAELKEHIENLLISELEEIEKLYEQNEISKEEYDILNEEVGPTIESMVNQFEQSWGDIIVKFEEKLKSYGIEFDENDNIQLSEEDKIKESDKYDATKVDSYRKANRAIKLLLATIPKMNADGRRELSSINGHKMIPVTQVFISLLNNLSSSRNTNEMLKNLKEMATNDINYSRLYSRITKQSINQGDAGVNSLTTTHETMLISALWKAVKKYNYAVKNVQILENDDINVGDAPLSTIANQLQSKYLSNIITQAKQNKGYFIYDPFQKAYTGNPDKLKFVDLTTKEGMVDFLKNLDIPFTVNELTSLELNSPKKEYKAFKDALFGIRKSISKGDPITKITKTSLGISGNLLKIAYAKAKLENPVASSTHYNINGDLTQSYVGPNAASQLYEFLSSIEGLTAEEFQDFPQYRYLLTDSFVEGSVVLDKMFTSDGSQRKETNDAELLFKVGYVGGLQNDQKGKSKESSKLNYKERLIQELNLNLEGWYLNLIPGDASLEHAIYLSNLTSADDLASFDMKEINSVFKRYFISELKMSKEGRPVVKGRNSQDLRFFKDILADETQKTEAKINKLHNDIINDKRSPEEVYKAYENKINAALDRFINKDTNELLNLLYSYNLVKEQENNEGDLVYNVSNIKVGRNLTEEELFRTFKAITINYMSANIELQKLLYSDPYQYSDQLKRTKSFLSPRQLIVGGQDPINAVFNEVWNRGFEKDDIGNTDFTAEAFRTVTYQDVTGVVDLPGYSDYTETDGSGIMTMKANRHLRIRAGEWNDAEERQYRYEVAWEKRDKNLELTEEEKLILEEGNPEVQSAFTSQKPIVSGNKADGNPWNDVVLDKYALYPLTYRIVKQLNPDSNAVKLYNKMQAENIDYIIFESGRKVGAMNAHAPYVNGEFNNAPFVEEGEGRNIINVPFEIMSIQTEVPSKEKALVTRGSQVTKLMTLDFMNAGVPIDFEVLDSNGEVIKDFSIIYSQWYSLSKEEKLEKSELYREIIRNQELLEAITEEGYNSLLKSLGIVKTEEGFRIVDKSKTANTLRNEILKREVNDNVSQALLQFFDNDVILESTPAYQQVRNILYSIADREFISPKMSGGQKVQIPSTFLESVRGEEVTINGKKGYASNNLKFYTNKDGERVAEFMVGRWFKSDKTDAELLEYFNDPNNKEAQRILSGVAFRIPTQKQNSIDRFVIKQFLPKEFGDNVVVPAELVAKVGSDFDIDKLSMYFKNVKIDKDGFPKLIEFLTDENSTVEERYVQYVKSQTDDYRDIIKELNNSSEKLDTKEKIKANFEKVNESRLEKEEYKTEKENLYNEGLEIFSELPSAVREMYYEFEKRLREAEVEGLEKNLLYKRFTQDLIKNYTENKTVKIVTSEGIEVTVSSKTVLPIFNALIENYDAVTEAYGVSQELQNKFLNLLDSAKSFKEFLTNKFELERAKIIAEFTGAETIEEFSNKSIYLQNGKKALQNAYIESSENLVSHPLNFNALIQPNSADQLKALSKAIVKQTVGSTFDYKNVGNMLRRNFMSRLRHAFVTGKYAIGIAAVNQTNTALSQRQPILLDSTMIKGEDKYWLDNGNISFLKHNKVSINGRIYPTLSLIRNAERSDKYPNGQDISDIIGQFIDGYVDISKGPWIMELGATPNVASTWLFLVKLGVPVDEVAYFMNQPIIRDYLKSVETAGYSYLFMEDFVENMLKKYSKDGKLEDSKITLNKRRTFKMPNLDSLKKSVGKSVDKMNVQELDQQRIMLFEFLKYAKMGEHLFHVTQGSNFDTSAFNDPYLVFKKQVQLVKAQNTMLVSIGEDGKKVIPAVNALLDNSFIGTLAQSIYNFRDSVSESGILMSDKKNVRAVLQNVLSEYVDMNNRDFVKLAQKAVNDFFDWIVQTKNGDESLNKYIKEYLVDNGGMTPEIVSFLKSVKDNTNHPLNGNMVIESMQVVPSSKAETGGANNIKVKPLSNEVVDQNSIIFAFRELRDYLKETGGEYENLYEQIVLTSMLQSGLSNSPISFSSILPYEDFQPLYNSVLSKIDNIPGINEFYELGVFQKNNWNNDDIVPNERAGYAKTKMGLVYNPSMAFIKEPIKQAISKNQLPVLLTQSIRSRSARFNHMVYSYEVNVPITEADKKAGIKTQKQKKDQMRKAGNYSFIKKGLFKKVINPTTNMPLIHSYNEKEYYVYKLVNAWGESYRANEFYDYERPSIIDNGMMKTEEFDDALITDAFKGGKKSLSQRLAEASAARTTKNEENVSTSSPTNFNIEEDYMFEPFSYSEDNFDIYDEPKNLVSLPSENLGELKMQPDNIAKIKAGTKTITNRTEKEKLEDGVYTLPDGTKVQVKLLGKYFVTFDVAPREGYNGPVFSQDEYARAEGFKDWKDFEKNNKFSTNFINGNQDRLVYDIKVINTNQNKPKGLPSINRTNKKC